MDERDTHTKYRLLHMHPKIHHPSPPPLTQVNSGSQVVNVGDEDELLALLQELVQQSTPLERVVDISMTWWIPAPVARVRDTLTTNTTDLYIKPSQYAHCVGSVLIRQIM